MSLSGERSLLPAGFSDLLAPDAAPSTFAEKLIEMTSDRDRYRTMAWQARREYELRLNWPAFTDRLIQVFEAVRR